MHLRCLRTAAIAAVAAGKSTHSHGNSSKPCCESTRGITRVPRHTYADITPMYTPDIVLQSRAHPFVPANREALRGNWLAVADALDKAVSHNRVCMLTYDAFRMRL